MAVIVGRFNNGAPAVRISISPAADSVVLRTFLAIIDTGFDGFVQLPVSDARELGLATDTYAEITYSDGSEDVVGLAPAYVHLGPEGRHGLVHVQEAPKRSS